MKRSILFIISLALAVSFYSVQSFADSEAAIVNEESTVDDELKDELYDELEDDNDEFETVLVKDSIESFNRAMFKFNDTIYHYGIKPTNKGYNVVLPEAARVSVKKFFLNIGTPGRLLNCLFQAKFKSAGIELSRFMINTSMGLAGFFDVAKYQFDMEMQDEDFGQTLAVYGMDNGTYLNLPFIGPSTVRDSVGFIGDLAMNPLTFVSLFVTPYASAGRPYDTMNDFSLDEGEIYESVTSAAIDPYIAIQDAYIQNRNNKIEN